MKKSPMKKSPVKKSTQTPKKSPVKKSLVKKIVSKKGNSINGAKHVRKPKTPLRKSKRIANIAKKVQ